MPDPAVCIATVRGIVERQREYIVRLTAEMTPEVASKYTAEHDAALAALGELEAGVWLSRDEAEQVRWPVQRFRNVRVAHSTAQEKVEFFEAEAALGIIDAAAAGKENE